MLNNIAFRKNTFYLIHNLFLQILNSRSKKWRNVRKLNFSLCNLELIQQRSMRRIFNFFTAYDNVCTTVLTYDLLNISNCVEEETEMMQAQSGTVMNSTQQYTKPFNVKVRDGSTEAWTVDAIYFPSLKYNIFGEKTVTESLGHQVTLHVSPAILEISQEINHKKCSL